MVLPISGWVLGLGLVIPPLVAKHTLPVSTFYAEWLTAILWLLAGICFAATLRPREHNPAHFAPGPLAWQLAGFALLSGAATFFAGRAGLPGPWPPIYLLAGAAAAWLGACVRRTGGLREAVSTLAIAMLVAASVGTLVEIIQLLRLEGHLSGLVSKLTSSEARRLYGNMNQANHQGTMVALGLAGAAYLAWSRSRRIRHLYAWGAVMLWLMIGMVLTGSRTAMLHSVLIALMAALLTLNPAVSDGHRGRQRLRLLLALLLPLCMIGVQFLVNAATTHFGLGLQDTVARLGSNEGGSYREALWRHGWQMFIDAPWFGVGWGGFAAAQFQQLEALGLVVEIASNSHNLVFDLLAKTGGVGAGLALLIGGAWAWRALRHAASPGGWRSDAVDMLLPLCCVAMLLLHSMVEYPLHYLFFWLPFCLFAGLVDPAGQADPARPRGAGIAGPRVLAAACIALAALFTALIIAALLDYRRVEVMFYGDARKAYESRPPRWFFTGHAHNGYAGVLPIDGADTARKLALHEAAIQSTASPLLIRRTALLMAMQGRHQEAIALMRPLRYFYETDLRKQAGELVTACDRLPAAARPARFCATMGEWGRGVNLPRGTPEWPVPEPANGSQKSRR